jgi:ATP-dependent Clp protease ATP-binding subunit ClpC
MFERFTEQTLLVVMVCQEESHRLKHTLMGTEQLLLGLIGKSKDVAKTPATKLLASARVRDISVVRKVVEELIGQGSVDKVTEMRFSEQAVAMLERSRTIADQRGHTPITPDHLLLALLQGNDQDGAIKVLQALKVDLEQLYEQALRNVNDIG